MVQTMQQFLAALDPGYVWAAAMLGALAYTVRSARREELDLRIVYWAGVLAIVFGLWGGHLLGIVYYGTDGRPFAWLRFWSGGQAQFGGLIAGAIAVFLFLKARKISLLTYADAIVPAVALGVSLGRIGCFLNGDDLGPCLVCRGPCSFLLEQKRTPTISVAAGLRRLMHCHCRYILFNSMRLLSGLGSLWFSLFITPNRQDVA